MSKSLHLTPKGLNRARFQAYAKLLRLRSGGQAEPPEDSLAFLTDDDEGPDAGEDDDDSIAPAALFDGHEDRMKRAFLDRLAELVANEKGGPHVSATLMVEWPDRVVVLVAKNTGIDRDLATFLASLEVLIRRVAMSGSWAVLPLSSPYLNTRRGVDNEN